MSRDSLDVIRSSLDKKAMTVRGRAYISGADPLLRPIQAAVIDTLATGIIERRKPSDIAR